MRLVRKVLNLPWPFANTYLRRLHAPTSEGERVRVERVLGAIRVAMAALAIIALMVDKPEPEAYIPIIFAILIVWLVHSIVTMLNLTFRGISKRGVVFLHMVDIAVPAVLSVFTHGPSTPLFSIFFFATVAASFRWGFFESLATSIFIVAWLTVEVQFLIGSTKPYGQLLEGQYEINRLILHSTYLIVLAYLTGRLGEDEKVRRAESAVITRVLRAAYAHRSVGFILREAFGEFLRIFQASRVCLVVQDLNSGRSYLFSLRHNELGSPRPALVEIPEEQATEAMLPDLPTTVFEKRTGPKLTVFTRENNVLRVHKLVAKTLPQLSIHAQPFSSLLAASHTLGNEWRFRLLVFDAQMGSARELEFAQSLFVQAITSAHGVYMNRRLRSQAGAMERARVARELHDGVIQSMISAEIRLEVLKRQAEREQSSLPRELNDIQELLRKEVIELRELMRELKPTDFVPDQLLDHMADLVERFARDTGINARFVCKQREELGFTPQTCRELMRIVQESLVNVRRHAHATQVVVSFARDGSAWKLTITDNGRGFPYSGRLESETLMNSAKGPLVIKERVRNIGGSMALESQPNQGSRLEITLRAKGSSAHGE